MFAVSEKVNWKITLDSSYFCRMSKSSGERKMTTGDVAKETGDGVTKLLIIDKVVYDVTNYTNR